MKLPEPYDEGTERMHSQRLGEMIEGELIRQHDEGKMHYLQYPRKIGKGELGRSFKAAPEIQGINAAWMIMDEELPKEMSGRKSWRTDDTVTTGDLWRFIALMAACIGLVLLLAYLVWPLVGPEGVG